MRRRGTAPAPCLSMVVSDSELVRRGCVRVRRMEERIAGPGALMRDVYFEGGGVFRCFRGRCRFTLEDRAPIVIHAGEAIVVYPGQRVTIEILDEGSRLVHAILAGDGVAAYFDEIGFFDGAHGRTSAQLEVFREVQSHLAGEGTPNHVDLVARLSDALVTFAHDFRERNGILYAAIRQIRENLRNRIVRLTPLYEQIHVGHTSLHAVFVESGMGSPAEFIRREQLRWAKRLLLTTQKPVSEIALETGFISATYFANFIKRMTGKTAREIRQRG
ncbi:MAG: helix-turn-helix domain-containing protein [Kiritimatiellia bacterium]